MSKILSVFLAVIMFLFPSANLPKAQLDTETMNTQYTYVFVHGLSGWGEYAVYYNLMPYWGIFGGNLMKYLRARGADVHAASVGPTESQWDRACELYAELTGTRVDYGEAHSARCGHARFGKDYSYRPLVDAWDAEHKINLLGHSFGGATVLQFVELMANGSAEEREASGENVSELFTGGKADWIYSVTTLAAPLCGTTAYEVRADIEVDPDATLDEHAEVGVLNTASNAPRDRIPEDCAEYDMYIDNAIRVNGSFEVLPNVYYFSIPCSMTVQNENGDYVPVEDGMEVLFRASAYRMGAYTGQTPGGFEIGPEWRENDGLVNTISARAPWGAPTVEFDPESGAAQPGVWNVFPTYDGDHMSLQGGMTKNNNIRGLYIDLIQMINDL